MHTSLLQLNNQNIIIFFKNFVHVDTAMTPSLPSVDNRGHLATPLPPSSCPRGYWMPPKPEKRYRKIVKMATICQKKITFRAAKTKCQQRAQVFQWIWIFWNPIKMLKKVWFEKAWELTFQSHLKLVSLVKKSMKSCFFFNFFEKMPSH